MRGHPQRGPSGATGTPPKLGLNRDGVTLQGRKPAISPKRCEIRPRLLLRTNRNSYTRFRLVTLADFEGRIQGVSQVFTFALLSQKRVKLRTSTLARTFMRSIRTKGRLQFCTKGREGVSRGWRKFSGTPYYLRNGLSYGLVTRLVHSQGPCKQKTVNNLWQKESWAYPGAAEIL